MWIRRSGADALVKWPEPSVVANGQQIAGVHGDAVQWEHKDKADHRGQTDSCSGDSSRTGRVAHREQGVLVDA